MIVRVAFTPAQRQALAKNLPDGRLTVEIAGPVHGQSIAPLLVRMMEGDRRRYALSTSGSVTMVIDERGRAVAPRKWRAPDLSRGQDAAVEELATIHGAVQVERPQSLAPNVLAFVGNDEEADDRACYLLEAHGLSHRIDFGAGA